MLAALKEFSATTATALSSSTLKEWIIFGTGSLGLLWYYVCLLDMGQRPTQQGTQANGFRQFQSLSVTTISVSLATYVGYVVGIPTDQASKGGGVEGVVTPLQSASAILYVLSLVIAVYFYARTKDETEPAITGLAKSLLGFVAGIFSVGLNIPTT